MTLPERLQTEQEQTLNRQRMSDHSRRKIAEALYHDNPETALQTVFKVLTGEPISEYPPTRDIDGNISLGSGVSLADNEYLSGTVTVGERSDNVYVNDSGGKYEVTKLTDGSYPVSLQLSEFRKYNSGTFDITRYEISDANVAYSSDTVAIDTTTVEFGAVVSAPNMTVNSLTIGDEITEGSE